MSLFILSYHIALKFGKFLKKDTVLYLLQVPPSSGTSLGSSASLQEILLCYSSPTSSLNLLYNPTFNKCPVEKTGHSFEAPPGFTLWCQPMKLSGNPLVSLFPGRISHRESCSACAKPKLNRMVRISKCLYSRQKQSARIGRALPCLEFYCNDFCWCCCFNRPLVSIKIRFWYVSFLRHVAGAMDSK